MLTQNAIITTEFERQSRDRIYQAAVNSRKLTPLTIKETAQQIIPAQKRILSLDWWKQLRPKTAN